MDQEREELIRRAELVGVNTDNVRLVGERFEELFGKQEGSQLFARTIDLLEKTQIFVTQKFGEMEVQPRANSLVDNFNRMLQAIFSSRLMGASSSEDVSKQFGGMKDLIDGLEGNLRNGPYYQQPSSDEPIP